MAKDVPTIDEISVSLFAPHGIHQLRMHQDILMVLAVVNFLTITVAFLVAPAF